MPKARNKIFIVSICCIYLFKEYEIVTGPIDKSF